MSMIPESLILLYEYPDLRLTYLPLCVGNLLPDLYIYDYPVDI